MFKPQANRPFRQTLLLSTIVIGSPRSALLFSTLSQSGYGWSCTRDCGEAAGMTERQFTPPWSVQELEACFIVKDGAGPLRRNHGAQIL
jgi:hypothetical protein